MGTQNTSVNYCGTKLLWLFIFVGTQLMGNNNCSSQKFGYSIVRVISLLVVLENIWVLKCVGIQICVY